MRKALGAAVLCTVMAVPASAQAADTFNSKPYRKAVTVNEHAGAFAGAAAYRRCERAHPRGGDAGQRGRRSTTSSTDEAQKGWNVRKQPFEFPFFKETAPSQFARTAPTPPRFVNGTDFATMTYSGSGDVTAPVTAVGPLTCRSATPPRGHHDFRLCRRGLRRVPGRQDRARAARHV